jgi:hypothetical protein
MDWSKIKTAVGQIAPWIAGTLGSPVAGVAVKALCDVFGLSGVEATPENVALRLAGATPAQLTDLREAEQKHEEFMTQIGYEHLEQLEQIAATDRDSSRKMQIAQPSQWPGVLSFITTVAVIGLIGASVAGYHLPNDPTAVQLIGSLTTGWGACLAYWVGTTRGSGNKDALLAQSKPSEE